MLLVKFSLTSLFDTFYPYVEFIVHIKEIHEHRNKEISKCQKHLLFLIFTLVETGRDQSKVGHINNKMNNYKTYLQIAVLLVMPYIYVSNRHHIIHMENRIKRKLSLPVHED